MLQKRKYSRQTTQKSIKKNQKLNIDPNLEILEINMLSINT